MTSDEIVDLATKLREIGVAEFSAGDVTVRFAPHAEPRAARDIIRDVSPLSPDEKKRRDDEILFRSVGGS